MPTRVRAGDLLIAPTNMPDSRFRKSVIMLTHDTANGSFGLCLNKPSEHLVTDIIQEIVPDMVLDVPLYWGGPVHPTTIWMLHDSDWETEYTIRVNDHWSITSNESMFHHMADHDYPKHFRIFFGYCNWAPMQLRKELDGVPPWNVNNSWLIARDPDKDWLMDLAEDELWASAASLSGTQAVAQWMP